jgi:GR25 family glycosyltransferase involved in LPS biosynthesis
MNNYFDSIFCINLKEYSRRRETVFMELHSVGLGDENLSFIEATHGSDLPETKKLLESNIISNPFIDPGGNLTRNIIACAISHKRAYTSMLDRNDEVSLIIEDDITWTKLGLRCIANGQLKEMLEDFKKSEYEIMWLGTCDTNIPVYPEENNTTGLFEYMRYLPEWAGHAYVIKNSAAKKLLDNNSPIKHAADVNIECTNVKICAPRKSLISQNGGEFERPIENRLRMRFDMSVVKNMEENHREYFPATTQISDSPSTLEFTDSPNDLIEAYNTIDRNNHFKGKIGLANIAFNLDVDYIKWNDFTTGNKDNITGWAHIYFKS